jgi:hypothetical protein
MGGGGGYAADKDTHSVSGSGSDDLMDLLQVRCTKFTLCYVASHQSQKTLRSFRTKSFSRSAHCRVLAPSRFAGTTDSNARNAFCVL